MDRSIIKKVAKSPFFWIGLALFSFITIFSYQKEKYVEKETERQIQSMVQNVSSNNIEAVSNILDEYLETLESIKYLSTLTKDIKQAINFYAKKDSLYFNVEVITDEERNYKNSYKLQTFFDDTLNFIQYTLPLNSSLAYDAISLKVPFIDIYNKIVASKGFSYAYITISRDGKYIYHPDEWKVGTNIEEEKQETYSEKNEKKIFQTYSDYLNLQVYRYFEVVDMGGEEWVIAANTPGISFKDLISNIRSAFIYMSASAALAFMFIFIFGILYWQKEFIKRQTVQQEKIKLELKNEHQKQQVLATELEQLKSGLNPHFLFNSLSSLRILVAKHPKEATNFATALSNLYRYLLKQQNNNLIFLDEELSFAKDYIYLQQIRFGDRIKINIDIPEHKFKKEVPPLSLQVLIENCIKHTKMSLEEPLEIEIYTEADYLIVKNNYNPISIKAPSKKGLDNLIKRYSYLTTQSCYFLIENHKFVGKIPLL